MKSDQAALCQVGDACVTQTSDLGTSRSRARNSGKNQYKVTWDASAIPKASLKIYVRQRNNKAIKLPVFAIKPNNTVSCLDYPLRNQKGRVVQL